MRACVDLQKDEGFAELEHLCPSPLPPMAMAFRTSSSPVNFVTLEMMGILDGSSRSAIMGGSLAHSNHLAWRMKCRADFPASLVQHG